jgi:methylisocitrate lyase
MLMTTWLEHDGAELEPAGKRLAALMQQPGIIRMPGAHNAMAGLLAKDAGFETLYVSGAAVTASMGYADLGFLSMEELCASVKNIARMTNLPILADGDTGYGEAINVMRLVRELEDAGAAAVHIEDQVLPKKCGHLNDKVLVSTEQMAAKIAAAKRASRHLLIMARTDSAASEGLDGAIARARAYVAAGADIIFPEALYTPDDFRSFAEAIDAPLMANMTEFGRTPAMTADELAALGYKIVIWPVSSLRIAAQALETFYRQLASDGTSAPQLNKMQTRKRLYEVIGYHDYEALDASIVHSLVPAVKD